MLNEIVEEQQTTYIVYEFPQFATSIIDFASSLAKKRSLEREARYLADGVVLENPDSNSTGLVKREEAGGEATKKPFIRFTTGCEWSVEDYQAPECVLFSMFFYILFIFLFIFLYIYIIMLHDYLFVHSSNCYYLPSI